VKGARTKKVILNKSGFFVSRKKGCIVVSDIRTKKEVAKYPILEKELGEVQVISGNLISTGALTSLAFNRIPVIVKTALGSPVGIFNSIDDYSHVETRLAQYGCYTKAQSLTIPKEIVLAKIKGQNQVLAHFGLRKIDFTNIQRVKDSYDEAIAKFNNENKHLVDHKFKSQLRYYEGSASMHYFREIFNLFPESFRPEKRKGFKAYDGLNNTFNLAYRILSNKVMVALFKARLEPYLGFYHTIKYGQPSLVCDFMDLYRYLIDHFLIMYCRKLDESDFVWKDDIHAGRKGKRAFLNKQRNKEFLDRLEDYFQTMVNVPRVKHGKRQELESVINEEAMLFANFIRGKRLWEPRTVPLLKINLPQILRTERKTKKIFEPFFPSI